MRAVTWVSGFEQDESTINNILIRIRHDGTLSNVASGLEALLFFRLKREWTERNRYSSLVEQLQLATALGKSKEAYIPCTGGISALAGSRGTECPRHQSKDTWPT